jgi:hydrogenase nickel incorporation protein HypB
MAEVKILKNILDANDTIARNTRNILKEKGIYSINMISSPGSGKTTFLERLIKEAAGQFRMGVLEGDVATTNDAERINQAGVPVVQINTEPMGGDCHLGAEMIRDAMVELPLDNLDLLVIENVGNLICPISFDLGEDRKIMILSVAEGEDKPLKYNMTFREANAVIISKIDIAEVLEQDPAQYVKNVKTVNPDVPVFCVSSKSGEGFPEFIAWLKSEMKAKVA